MMQFGTIGCAEQTPHSAWSNFDFIIADSYFGLSANATAKYLNKPLWVPLFYGHKHYNWFNRPRKVSGYQEYIYKYLSNPMRSHATTVIIANEFINFRNEYYPNFKPKDIVNYIKWAHHINADFEIIISEFKPWENKRWDKMLELSKILRDSTYKFKGVGIQLHLKMFKNAEIVIAKLPNLISKFKEENIPVHFSEVSVWQHKNINIDLRSRYYLILLNIAISMKIESFSPWWIYPDYDARKPMPTFIDYEKGYWHDVNLASLQRLLTCHEY